MSHNAPNIGRQLEIGFLILMNIFLIFFGVAEAEAGQFGAGFVFAVVLDLFAYLFHIMAKKTTAKNPISTNTITAKPQGHTEEPTDMATEGERIEYSDESSYPDPADADLIEWELDDED